ncbi:MAG TPA: glucose-6-phosphate isomerase [Candidatus Krumholzibacteria bacterium]|nr:glucose-6-phosphate isomerase [Candidatus Krumholzibacteria bacterium]HPD70441.1 glucose-6-phosphate isomerase [Candidatus Krumholzibacteria bacterium]HRY39859.1 glucose-6-phosphate isomerase [Candidatus Krumholzibacteria bacterium]
MDKVNGILLDTSRTESFLPPADVDALAPRVAAAAADLAARRGEGSDFLGWLDLPANLAAADFAALELAAAQARRDSEACVVVGIGGSYLGARAVLDALGHGRGAPEVIFAGTSLCASALRQVTRRLERRDFRLVVISKSGTTLEPALSFRVLRRLLEERYGTAAAAARVTAITDARRGALRELADRAGWESWPIPNDVGGRFSVLTPVGLLPLAMAGIDIRALVAGAADMRRACLTDDLRANPAHLYAASRFGLYGKGYQTEILATFHTGLATFGEWWKQLYGESEGKDGKGIFPASTVYTTDLHSLGQYLQDGRRSLLETFLVVREDAPEVVVPADPGGVEGLDGLDDLVGRRLDSINVKAYEGTRTAHVQGGVPCLALELDRLTPEAVGGLLYLFEKGVAIGGRLLGVNPFDQPGVEAYKREMFRLLGRG